MKTIKFRELTENLQEKLDMVSESAEVYKIPIGKGKEGVVVMSLQEYNSWKETEYFSRIRESLEQVESKILRENDLQNLKYEIIKWIIQTGDSSLLEMLKELKDANVHQSEDWYNELTSEEVASIERGKNNHEKGEVLTSKEFWTGHGD